MLFKNQSKILFQNASTRVKTNLQPIIKITSQLTLQKTIFRSPPSPSITIRQYEVIGPNPQTSLTIQPSKNYQQRLFKVRSCRHLSILFNFTLSKAEPILIPSKPLHFLEIQSRSPIKTFKSLQTLLI